MGREIFTIVGLRKGGLVVGLGYRYGVYLGIGILFCDHPLDLLRLL